MGKSAEKRRGFDHILYGLWGLAAAGLCIWCAAGALRPVLAEKGEGWLLHMAGLTAAAETPSPVFSPPPSLLPENIAALFPGEVDAPAAPRQERLPQPVSTPDPARETGTVEVLKMSVGQKVKNFTVKDETGTGLDLEKELETGPSLSVKKDGTPVVLLYSTHTTESFILEGDGSWYYRDDDFRTRDPESNIVCVAAEAKKVIEAGGFGVIHDTTVHDDPAYSGSYNRSMETIRKNLEKYPTIQITVDVHRDAFGESGAVRYKPVAQVNGKQAAQMMILTGCDTAEDSVFPNWKENLRFALKLQQKGETMFPGLYRSLYFCRRNYNMHATRGSLLVEVGTDVNTLEEAKYSGRLLGETVLAVLEDLAREA